MDFNLQSPIYIGARYDLNPDRHFLGSLALLLIYSSPVSDAEASCLFASGDSSLVVAGVGQHRRYLTTAAVAKPNGWGSVTSKVSPGNSSTIAAAIIIGTGTIGPFEPIAF